MFQAVDFGGRHDVIHVVAGERVRRLDGRTGAPVWDVSLRPDAQPAVKHLPRYDQEWPRLLRGRTTPAGRQAPQLLLPAPDLDGDGVPDLVWVTPTLLVMSGKDGKVLWWHNESLAGMPAVADVDRDGKPDLVVAVEPCHVGALSGATGRLLWRHAEESRLRPPAHRRGTGHFPFGQWAQVDPPEVVRINGKPTVVFLVGTRHLVGLDLATGQPLWPAHDLGLEPSRPPVFADLDGDGSTDALLLSLDKASAHALLTALSLRTRQPLWQVELEAYGRAVFPTWEQRWSEWPTTGWPLVTDLGRGKPDVLMPYVGDDGPGEQVGVEVRDAAGGRVLWQHAVQTYAERRMSPAVDRFVIGPDLDGDGHRELFVVSEGLDARGTPTTVHIDALSGEDGHAVWWQRLPFAGKPGQARWWDAPLDGWPQLLVPLAPRRTCVVSAGTGRLTYVLPEVADARPADLDGDGVPELLYEHPATWGGTVHAVRGLAGERWRRPGRWKLVGDLDGDGVPDLVTGRGEETGHLRAASGTDGHNLWHRSRDVGDRRFLMVLPFPGTDQLLLWDYGIVGHKDPFRPFQALSGRTGEPLWQCQEILQAREHTQLWRFAVDLHDLDQDGIPDVLFRYDADDFDVKRTTRWLVAFSGKDGRILWKTLVQETPDQWYASTGDIDPSQWSATVVHRKEVPLLLTWMSAMETETPSGQSMPWLKDRWTLSALDARTGQPLWGRSTLGLARVHRSTSMTPKTVSRGTAEEPAAPLVVDFEGDGRPAVVFTELRDDPREPGQRLSSVVCLDPSSGKPRWTWTGPSFPAGEHWRLRTVATPPQPVRLGARTYACASVLEKSGGGPQPRLLLLDGHGRVVQRRDILQETPQVRFWVHDLDGDGRDEVVCFSNEHHVVATGNGLKEVAWQRPLTGPLFDILAVQPAGRRYPATLALWTGEDVWGLAGPTGRPRWRCRLPRPASGEFGPPQLGQPEADTGLPTVVADLAGQAVVCLRAEPTTPDGTYAARPRERLAVQTAFDRRQLRILPWARNDEFWKAPVQAVLLCGALVVLPLLLLYATLRYRSWKWAAVTLAYAVPAGYLYSRPSTTAEAVLVFGVPLCTCGVQLCVRVVQRRWRKVLWLVGLGAVVSVGLAAVGLWMDAAMKMPREAYASWRQWATVAAGQAWSARYAADGWYGFVFYGIYALGGLLLVTWGVRLLARGVRAAWRWPRRRRLTPA
jgi:outer membrane protein assembly factor BamB